MKRRRLLRVIAIMVAVPAAAVLILVLYLTLADLSGWRDTVAGALSDSLGREVTISGEFVPEIGLRTRLEAGGVAVANPDWSEHATMASVERLVVEIDLVSLLSGPLVVHDIEVHGANVLLERDGHGRANWLFVTGAENKVSGGQLELVLRQVAVTDLELVYRDPSRPAPLEIVVSKLHCTEDESGMLDLSLAGRAQGHDVELAGRFGTLDDLLRTGAIRHSFEGRVGGIQLSTSGTVEDLASFSGVSLSADVRGQGLAELRDLAPLPDGLEGPLRVHAEVVPTSGGSDLRLDATVGDLTVEATAALDSLLRPQSIQATVNASGPSLSTAASLAGIRDLPDEPFEVSGGVLWKGSPITFKQVELRVGDNRFSADGVLGAPPAMLDTDFRLEGGGPDLSRLAAPAGVRLPADTYFVSGRIVRVDGGVQVENAEARIGRTSLTASGFVGDPPEHTGTALVIHADGPSLARFSGLAGIELPDQPFTVDGRLAEGSDAIILEDVRARLGPTAFTIDGRVRTERRFAGSVLRIGANGPDAAALATAAAIEGIPAEPWTVDGTVHVLDHGYRLETMSARLGSLAARVDGRVIPGRGLVGTDVTVHAEDTDLSHTASLAGLTGLPAQPLRLDGRLRVEAAELRIDEVRARLGDVDVEANGLVGVPKDLDGTRIGLDIRGPNLATVGTLIRQTGLPRVPFSVTGDLRIDRGAWSTEDLVAEVDGNRLDLSGTVAPTGRLAGTELRIDLSGPDLGRAGTLAAGFVDLPELPAGPFSVSTRLDFDEGGCQVEGFRATLSGAVALIEGRVGTAADSPVGELTFQVDGPDASLFSTLAGATMPAASFEAKGRVRHSENGFEFDRVALRFGDYRAALHGRVGEPPRLIGTDLEVSAAGPGLGLIWDIAGIEKLPDLQFAIAGQFRGTPERFSADDLVASVGASDFRGAFEVDITGKPALTARFESKVLDLAPFAPRRTESDGPPDGAPREPGSASQPRVFNEKPINFGLLQRLDADVEIEIAELELPLKRFRDVRIDVELSDGRLEVPTFHAADLSEGRGTGSLLLEPVGAHYRLNLALDLNGIQPDLAGASAQPAASRPPIDLDVELDAVGRSPHDFAESSTGHLQLVAGRGTLDNSLLDAVTAPIFATLIDVFNPFTKQERTSELECAVILFSLDNGIARLDPMVLKSDAMTMLGDGTVNLDTEKLNLEWVTKPRKGIGISASMLTNPYIRLGGTLARPSIQLKEADAVISTGAAVATAGISLAARGLYDRITAERNVCKKALKKIAASRQGD